MSAERLYVLVERVPVQIEDAQMWAEWFEHADRRVAWTEVQPGVEVSTVFLGLDHDFTLLGPPKLFETMVFSPGHSEDCWRCSTWEEAIEQHKRAVAEVSSGLT